MWGRPTDGLDPTKASTFSSRHRTPARPACSSTGRNRPDRPSRTYAISSASAGFSDRPVRQQVHALPCRSRTAPSPAPPRRRSAPPPPPPRQSVEGVVIGQRHHDNPACGGVGHQLAPAYRCRRRSTEWVCRSIRHAPHLPCGLRAAAPPRPRQTLGRQQSPRATREPDRGLGQVRLAVTIDRNGLDRLRHDRASPSPTADPLLRRPPVADPSSPPARSPPGRRAGRRAGPRAP